MARTGASYPSIFLGLDASGIAKGLQTAKSILKNGMESLAGAVKTPLIGVALANQAAEFSAKITRLFGEPFRQLMEQEDLTSRFSLVAGGADKSSQAFEGFRRVSRETGVAIADMAQGLETLLQGQFSFEGARQQILDLTSVAAVLGQGSLPMLAQAAAKFRSQAFAGFEDINAIAAQGIPIYDALAQRLGVTADEARRMAREGLVTGLQARGALNDAANAQAVKGAGGAQEQTLSGVVSRLREGLNQTLATIGEAVSRAIDVPTVLARFRGFVEGIRTVVEVGLGPLKGVIGPDGGGLREKFQAAQDFTISALKAVSDGFFSFLRGLEGIVNQFRGVVEYLASWLPENFTDQQEEMISDWQKANQKDLEVKTLGGFFDRTVKVDASRQEAIAALGKSGQLTGVASGGPIDLGLAGMQAKVNDALEGARKRLADQNNAAVKAVEDQAAAQRRVVEAQKQASEALDQFAGQFASAFDGPLDIAVKKNQQLDALIAQAAANGVQLTQEQIAANDQARAAIGRGVMDLLNQTGQIVNQAKESVAYNPGTTDLIASITRAQNRETFDPSVNIQQRVANLAQQQLEEQRRQNAYSAQIVVALAALNQKPAAVQNIAALR